MEQLPLLALLFGIGFLASFLGNFISGGASLISVSSLLLVGLPPHLSLATYRVGAFASRLGGIGAFIHAKKVVWKLVLPLSLLALVGSVLGTQLLVATDEELLRKIIGGALILMIPFLFLKKDLGIVSHEVSKHRRLLGFISYFSIAVVSGFFAAGTGIFFLYVYLLFFGLTILETKGTDKIPGLFLDIGGITIFLINGIVNPLYLLAYIPGTFLGATLGARQVIKLGDRWLKPLVALSIALIALTLLST